MDTIERYNRYIGFDEKFDFQLFKTIRIGDKAQIDIDLSQDLSGFSDIISTIYINNTYIEHFSLSGGTLTVENESISFDLTTSVYPVGEIVSKIRLIESDSYNTLIVCDLGKIVP